MWLVFALAVFFHDAIPGTLVLDSRGARGTGVKEWKYSGGQVQLRERYFRGRLQRSEWFRPDGGLILRTDWVNGDGVGLRLRDDGSIRERLTYRNEIAEGPATYYAPDGTVLGEAVFRDGARVSGYDPRPAPKSP